MHLTSVELPIVMCNRIAQVVLPSYATDGAAGMDLQADIREPMLIHSGERKFIPTGVMVAVPPGFEIQVRPRSGLAFKHGLSVVNSPGTVDCDYRGEIGVLLINHGKETFTINPGDRIAQMVLSPVTRAILHPQDQLDATERGEGGYGSTGVKAPTT